MTEESPPAASWEPPNRPPQQELFSKVSRALLAEPGGRARKRRALRRARGKSQRLAELAERVGESVSLPTS